MMAPLLPLLHPQKLLLAGVLAGAVCVLPTTATFGKGRARPVFPLAASVLVPAPAPAPAAPVPTEVPEPQPTDALFYDIPPSQADPAWLAQIQCDSAATTEDTPGKIAVDFSGYVTWQKERFPEKLPTPTYLTIELQDASSDAKVQDRPLLYIYQQEVSDIYEEDEPIQFSFCAKVPEAEQYGLYARVVPAADNETKTKKSSSSGPQLGFAGLTDVEAGLKEYKNVRVRLFNAKVRDTGVQAAADKDDIAADEAENIVEEEPLAEGTQPARDAGVQRPTRDPANTLSSPTMDSASMSLPSPKDIPVPNVEVCNFSDLQPGIRGVAARVIMEFPASLAGNAALPHPTILTVLLEEMISPAVPGEGLTTEPEPLAVFSSDITEWYSAGEELTAMLCAQIPAQSEKAEASYRLRSLLNVGWDGYEESNGDDAGSDLETVEPLQQLRSGDYVAETTLTVVPDKDSYIVRAALVPYDS